MITKLSKLVDLGLIRVHTKFERKNEQKLTFFYRTHQIFGLVVKITSWGDLSQNLSISKYS